MSNDLPTVAIAGASGDLGQRIVASFTSRPFASCFKKIVLLSRNPGHDVPGTTLRIYSATDVVSSLEGVTVVINCIGSKGNTVPFKEALIKAIANTKTVKMYIASEFGVDHYINEEKDPDFDFVEWRHKKELSANAKETFKAMGRVDVKIVHLFPGLLMELSIGPWFGMNCKDGKFEAVGNSKARCSYTSMNDVGKVAAVLASMEPTAVPERLRVSGDCVTIIEIAREMGEASKRNFEVSSVNTKDLKAREMAVEGGTDPSKYLRVLIGNGKIDFSDGGLGNQNSLVNAGEELWKWKTMQEYARETKGTPWAI